MQLRDEHAVWREVDGEIVILDLRSSRYLQLNASGTALWRWLAQDADEPALVSALAAQFDLAEAQAARDVTAFLRDLEAQGFLSR